jgi:hypothetical protein
MRFDFRCHLLTETAIDLLFEVLKSIVKEKVVSKLSMSQLIIVNFDGQ